jgi:hypothetical protein
MMEATMAADETAYFHWDEGRSHRIGRITLTFKSGDVNAGYSVCETVSDPGITGAGLHRHPSYEETQGERGREIERRHGST